MELRRFDPDLFKTWQHAKGNAFDTGSLAPAGMVSSKIGSPILVLVANSIIELES